MEPKKQGRKRTSCEECHRLKIKCDQGMPCSNCIKRGIQAICPGGLVSGSWRKNRVILANTEDLHVKIEQLSGRIRELEDALSTVQADTSNEHHPLLSSELLQLKIPLGITTEAGDLDKKVDEVLTNSFGTLTISSDGSSIFYGNTAVSGFFEARPARVTLQNGSILFSNPTHTSFPFFDGGGSLNRGFSDALPPPQEAWRFCLSYYSNAAWLYNIIPEDEFKTDVFATIFGGSGGPPTPLHLSLLWSTMALGAQADPTSPLNTPIANEYYLNAEGALMFSVLLQSPSLLGIYAIFNICFYLHMSHLKEDIERCIILQGVMIKMAQSMGLHRDPTKFDLPEREVSRRRRVFWEIYLFDTWLSFNVGRPPSISHIHVDTVIPLYREENNNPEGFHHFKHEFTQKNLRLLMDKAFLAGQPIPYSTIIQLDKTIRNQTKLPSSLLVPGLDPDASPERDSPEEGKTMQRHILFTIREVLFLYLHRRFFAHALRENPSDPLNGTQFSVSFLATYNSSIRLLSCLRHCFTVEPQATLRRVWIWNHGYSAVIVLAAIVTLSPSCSLAPSALIELEAACELFAKASENRFVATKLETIRRLLQHARIAYETREFSPNPLMEDVELSGMNGATRLIWASPKPIYDYNQSQDVDEPGLPSNIYSPVVTNGSNMTDFPLSLDNITVPHIPSNNETYNTPSYARETWAGIGTGNLTSAFPEPFGPFAPLEMATTLNNDNSSDGIDWEQLLSQLGVN